MRWSAKRLDALSKRSVEISHKSERAAARYFAREATRLQQLSGREIGANLEKRHDTDFRVIDFHADSGEGARNHVSTWAYLGEYEWAGIMHTHPTQEMFSGRGSYGQNGRYRGVGITDDSDVAEGYAKNQNVFLALPDGQVFKMNILAWRSAVEQDSSGRRIYAHEFEEDLNQ